MVAAARDRLIFSSAAAAIAPVTATSRSTASRAAPRSPGGTEDRVIAIDLKKKTVATFVQAGLNVPVENGGAGITGFNNPDNVAEGPDGRLWIVEDNVPSDIWVTDKDRNKDGAADNVYLFASLKDSSAEGTGIYFGKDPKTLFVNIQHAAKPLADGTWKITNHRGHHGDDDDDD